MHNWVWITLFCVILRYYSCWVAVFRAMSTLRTESTAPIAQAGSSTETHLEYERSGGSGEGDGAPLPVPSCWSPRLSRFLRWSETTVHRRASSPSAIFSRDLSWALLLSQLAPAPFGRVNIYPRHGLYSKPFWIWIRKYSGRELVWKANLWIPIITVLLFLSRLRNSLWLSKILNY
jgi:hypothetical protein